MAERQEFEKDRSFAASRVAIVYAIAASAWILISDGILELSGGDARTVLRRATVKGLLFVVVTALLLYGFLRKKALIRNDDLADLALRAHDADRIAATLSSPRRDSGRRDLIEAHQALTESEARLRLIVGAAAEAIIICDEKGMVLSWNREAERMFGRTEEEAIGEELSVLVAVPADRGRCREVFHSVRADAGSAREELIGINNGNEFPMEMSVIAVTWGARTLHTAFIRDISDRVRAAHEAEQLAAIVNASADAIMSVSNDGSIVSWNASAERMFGYSAESARGSSLARLFPPGAKETVRWLLDSIPLGIPIEATPIECARQGDERFQAFISISPVRADGRVSGAAVVVRDASEQLTARDRVKDAEILASLGRLAAAVGHQFNNVLMGILPFVDVLKRNELPPQATRAVEQIAKSVERGRRVTSDIQSFTRASEAPALRNLPVMKWLDGLRPELDALLGSGVEISMSVEPQNLALFADSNKLRQVILNLAANARESMPGGGRFTLRVSLSNAAPAHALPVDGQRDWAEIIVQDSGEGLDEESQRRIFEPLFAKKRGGSGLELATVQQIIRSHGGTIEVSSAAGAGATFRMLLPAAPAAEEEVSARPEARRAGTLRRVLLVEDDLNVADGLSQALRAHGMMVIVVHTGAEALPAVRAHGPDVVVLDIRLPDANGFDVYRDIAALWPDLPVVFSTGHADEFDLEAAEPLGLRHVELLRKPYATETLLETMQRVTGGSAPSGETRRPSS